MARQGSLLPDSPRLLFYLAAGMLALACSVDRRGLGSGSAGGVDGVMMADAAVGGASGSNGGGTDQPPVATGGVTALGSGGAGGEAEGGATNIGGAPGGNGGAGSDNPSGGQAGQAEGGQGGGEQGEGGQGEGGQGGGAAGATGEGAGGQAGDGGGGTPGASGGSTAAGGRGGAGGAGRGGTAGGAGGAPPCGPATCANGCCAGNVCVTDRTADFCGDDGGACAKCSKCFRCGARNSCEVIPRSPWNLVCASATIAATKWDGTSWDGRTSNTPPDPICQLKVGTTTVSTSIKRDTFTPSWNESITPETPLLTASRLMSQAMPWSIDLSDFDLTRGYEFICQVSPQFGPEAFAEGTVTLNAPQCPSLTITLSCGL